MTYAESPVEQRGEKRSDPEGGHMGEDVVSKSRAIEDTGVHKMDMIQVEKQKSRTHKQAKISR